MLVSCCFLYLCPSKNDYQQRKINAFMVKLPSSQEVNKLIN